MGKRSPSVVKEQSHKREMQAAVRGDFERLRRRGVAVTIGDTSAQEPNGADAAPPNGDGNPPQTRVDGRPATIVARLFGLR